jgi:hypothetical protein
MRIVTAVALLTHGAAGIAMGHQGGAKVENVHYEIVNGAAVIHYDFLGGGSDTYRIDLFLRSEKDSTFNYRPKNIRGDVGEGNHAGMDRHIFWEMKGEFAQGIEGSDYYFEVRAERVSDSKSTLLWIGAGVAVLGAIAALHFIGSGTGETPTSSPQAQFPTPPGRP